MRAVLYTYDFEPITVIDAFSKGFWDLEALD